jgi:DNA-binding transcriptional LysR family regulator
VSNTDYITILPREVVKPELISGSLREISIQGVGFTRSVGLMWLTERKLGDLAQAFITHTIESLKV